jgi:N-dimethylarginine dimethylaminohydrolase
MTLSKIFTDNEWDSLKEIIIGSATNAHFPRNCPIFRSQEKNSSWKKTLLPSGPVCQTVIDEANEDLEKLSNFLTSMDVKVYRPNNLDFEKFDGMYNYCPRDRILIIGDKVFDCPMLFPTRKAEIQSILPFLSGSKITKCNYKDAVFDAANICRLGKDILYLISRSGNYKGAQFLQDLLGKEYKVHILKDIYNGVHIDSTISPVSNGIVVINKDRITKNNLPSMFKNWNIIPLGKDDIVEQPFVSYPYASNYIALNFLMVSSKLAICDPKQYTLRKKLEQLGVETIGIDLRHSRTLGGGHHCVSLDLKRGNNVA